MVKEYIFGKMVIDIRVNLLMIRGKGWENIIGVMVEFIKENGRRIE